MASWQNGKLTKWQVDKMASWQNVKFTKCQFDKMASWQNGKLTKWQVDKMASWQNGKLTKWQVDYTGSWQNGNFTQLWSYKNASFQTASLWNNKLKNANLWKFQVNKLASWWNDQAPLQLSTSTFNLIIIFSSWWSATSRQNGAARSWTTPSRPSTPWTGWQENWWSKKRRHKIRLTETSRRSYPSTETRKNRRPEMRMMLRIWPDPMGRAFLALLATWLIRCQGY